MQDKTTGKTISVEGVLADFPTPIISKIGGEPKGEALVKLHRLISGNTTFLALNLGGGCHGHLALTMTAEDYMAQTGYAFVPPHNTGNYPPMMGTAQVQALRTERF